MHPVSHRHYPKFAILLLAHYDLALLEITVIPCEPSEFAPPKAGVPKNDNYVFGVVGQLCQEFFYLFMGQRFRYMLLFFNPLETFYWICTDMPPLFGHFEDGG